MSGEKMTEVNSLSQHCTFLKEKKIMPHEHCRETAGFPKLRGTDHIAPLLLLQCKGYISAGEH
jgi:hypothetical protein